jgi:hypothetical protein
MRAFFLAKATAAAFLWRRPKPPPIAPARGPPEWDDDSEAAILDEERFTSDSYVQPEPEYEFDRRVNW